MKFCYFSGKLLPESCASISIHNIGLQRSYGVFDLFRSRNEKPVFMDDHLSRFDRSQRFLNLSRQISQNEIRHVVSQLQHKNGFKNATFKLMLLGDGMEADEQLAPLFFIIHTPISDLLNPKESNVILHDYIRESPEIKSLNYLMSNILHRRKKMANAVDVIYHHHNIVSEASRSNVFIVKDRILLTPGKGILEGITRKYILKIATAVAKVEIADISVDDLKTADEVFISSTLKEIMPIVKVDERQIRNGKIGPFTKKLQKLFNTYIQELND